MKTPSVPFVATTVAKNANVGLRLARNRGKDTMATVPKEKGQSIAHSKAKHSKATHRIAKHSKAKHSKAKHSIAKQSKA